VTAGWERRIDGTKAVCRGAAVRAGIVLTLTFVLASCAKIPSPEQANDAVSRLREHEDWAWALALVLRSRTELGAAWSLVPDANQGTGLVTTGPYRIVRHPIYLGLTLLAMGEALAFGSWPALMVVLFGIVPTFAWRARAEEKLLSRTFGQRFADYRRRTSMIIPHVL